MPEQARTRPPIVSAPGATMPRMSDVIPVFDGPPFTSPAEVQSAPYRREPYVRATGGTLGTVDAKVCRYSSTHLLLSWQERAGGPYLSAWVPQHWCTRIPRAASAWSDPYGQGD